MKKEWLKGIAAVLAVSMTVATIAACDRKKTEPPESLIPSETFVPATVQEMEDDELTALIKEVVGDDWNNDFSTLTEKQRSAIKKKLTEKGYHADVTENGIVYYSFTPTADEEEIAEVVKTVVGDESWTGSFTDLNDDDKDAVRDELRSRGYDVEIGEKGGLEFLGEAERKEQTTKYSYNLLPTQEQIIGAVGDVIGSSAALKWDGNMLSLTEDQRNAVLKKLNDYGFDLALNEKGEFYMVHNPANKVTYESAYTPMEIEGTTRETTTVLTTAPEEPMEHVTGTTAAAKAGAPTVERTALSTFGGTGGDTFRHVTTAKDGGYIVTAQFRSKDGSYADSDKTWEEQRSAVIKYDKDGNYQWKAMIGGKNLVARSGVTMSQSAELKDGSIVTVGYTGAKSLGAADAMDGLMVCYDASGSQKWIKRFAGTDAEAFECVCATPDGGYVVGGRTTSSDGDFEGLPEKANKAILIKFNAKGEKEWIQAFNSGTLAAHYNALAVTDKGYIYAACFSPVALSVKTQLDMLKFAGYGGSDSIIFKFDPDGTLVTHRTVGGSGNDQVMTLALADGGVIVGGRYANNVRDDCVFAGKHNYGGYDAFLIRMDASLNVEWVKTFGGVGNDVITGVAQIDGGYAAVGYSNSTDNAFSFLGSGEADAFVLTVSSNGTDVQKTPLNGTKADQATGMVCQDGKQFAVVGSTGSSTNMFSGLTPAPAGKAYVSFFGLYTVK